MRLMKRILSAAAVLALSASLLVGCSSGTASSVPVSEVLPQKALFLP